MGTNFYLRRTSPRPVVDEYHVAKRSAGTGVRFQDSDNQSVATDPFGEHCPEFHSTDDVEALLASGEWSLVDEEGAELGSGAEGVGAFRELCREGARGCAGSLPGAYSDRGGHVFSSMDFR